MVLNSKGQVTIPAQWQSVLDADAKGRRSVRRLRDSATAREIAGLSTDEIMALLRGE